GDPGSKLRAAQARAKDDGSRCAPGDLLVSLGDRRYRRSRGIYRVVSSIGTGEVETANGDGLVCARIAIAERCRSTRIAHHVVGENAAQGTSVDAGRSGAVVDLA